MSILNIEFVNASNEELLKMFLVCNATHYNPYSPGCGPQFENTELEEIRSEILSRMKLV